MGPPELDELEEDALDDEELAEELDDAELDEELDEDALDDALDDAEELDEDALDDEELTPLELAELTLLELLAELLEPAPPAPLPLLVSADSMNPGASRAPQPGTRNAAAASVPPHTTSPAAAFADNAGDLVVPAAATLNDRPFIKRLLQQTERTLSFRAM